MSAKPQRSKDRRPDRAERLIQKHQPRDLRWWRAEEPHVAVFDIVRRIGDQTSSRRRQDLYHACLYDDAELATLMQGSQALNEFTPQTLTSNVVKRQVDTFVAKISKNRPVPMALTSGGTYTQQRRAKALSKFFEGVLEQVDFWPTRTMRLRDGAVFGSGLAHNYRVGGRLVHDRMYPWDVRVDPREAQYGKPRSLYVRRFVDRLVAMERWPKHADDILEAEAKAEEDRYDVGWDGTSDLVLVIEAWHLPSREGARDGSHAICVSNKTLSLDLYERDYFPFSKWDFSPGIVGWWGEGMAKQLSGLQYEVNAIGLRLQEQAYMTGTYVWAGADPGIEVDRLDNGVLGVVRSPQQPTFFNPPAWHPQIFDYYRFLRGAAAAEEVRISELSSRSEIPRGLDGASGKALRTYHDIEAEGFVPQGRADEEDVIDTCWQLLDLAEEIHAEAQQPDAKTTGLSVQIEERRAGRSVLKDIDFGEVRLDRDEFTLRVFPTSFLSGTPAEKLASVRELIDAGFLSQDEAMSLLDFPDLERVMSVRGAARRNIEKILQGILESDDPESVYVYPEPAFNLELCRALAIMTYLDAWTDDAPEENLRWVLQFAIDAEEQLSSVAGGGAPPMDDAAAAAEAQMGPEPGLPPMPGEEQQYAPPDAPPLPANAVAPEAMASIPQV